MSLIRINRHPSDRDLRVFATLWLLFAGVAAWTAQTKGFPTPALLLAALAAGVATAGWIAPQRVRLIYLSAIYVTFPLGFVLSHVILAVAYYVVLTPIGLIMRALGRDPLQRRFAPDRTTYWAHRTTERDAESYFRQH